MAKVPLCTFNGLPVPIVDLAIRGEQQIEIHRYRFLAGGRLEIHKRNLWSFHIKSTFQAKHRSSLGHPMFPDVLNGLRGFYQNSQIGTLLIPHIGNILVIIKDWDEKISGSVIGGADLDITFLEHGTHSFGGTGANPTNALDYKNKVAAVKEAAKAIPKKNILAQIFAAADKIIGFRDQIFLNYELMAAGVESLTMLIREADRTLEFLNDPENYQLVVALIDLWTAATDLVTSPEAKIVKPRVYIVDVRMSVMEVAQRIYGDNNRARDLLELNQFEDAMRIPAGTKVLYVPD